MARIQVLDANPEDNRITRRQFVARSAALGLALSPLSAFIASCGGGSAAASNSVTWVSPRGTLEVLDDYPYWVAEHFGWFGDMDTTLEPGPQEATATTKLVTQDQADMGYPSIGVFSLALEAGTPLKSIWCMGAYDTFDFAFSKESGFTDLRELEGKTIVLGDPGWESICNPLLAQAGVDTSSIEYQGAGPGWGQALSEGQADAALAWEGLRAQWKGQGLDFDYLLGKDFSKFPGNSFVVREQDMEDESLRDLYGRYLRGWAMGMEFGQRNPRAATQITMEQFPSLKKQMTPPIAVESLMQQTIIFRGDWPSREGWGWHDFASYDEFFVVAEELGQVTEKFAPKNVVSNDFVADANDFDMQKIAKASDEYELSSEYEKVNEAEIEKNL